MGSSLILKLITWIPNIFGSAKKRLPKTHIGYSLLSNLGIQINEQDFDSLYSATIYEFETTQGKHDQVIDLFKEKSARKSFKDDFYNNTTHKLLADLAANLNTKNKYLQIRNAQIDLSKEIDDFLTLFVKKVNETKLPKEKEVSDKLDQIRILVSGISKESFDLSEYITEIAELRKGNKHDSVLKLLQSFKDKKWDTLSKELKYRVTLNFAVTHFELGEKKKGARYFIELLCYGIKLEDAYGFAALGHALLAENDIAINYANKCLELNTENENAYLALLFSKEDTLELKDIDQLIPKDIQVKPGLAINIANIKEKKGDMDGAFTIYKELERTHLDIDAFKFDILVQLANNRINSIKKKDNWFYGQITEIDKEKLEYALEKLNQAWTEIQNTDLLKHKWYILTNRGVVKKVLGFPQKAEEDYQKSLELNQNYLTYIHLLQLKLDEATEYDRIINEIEKLSLKKRERQEFYVFKANAPSRRLSNQEIVSLLSRELPEIEENDLKKQYYSILIDIHLTDNRLEEAEKLGLEITELNIEDPSGYLLLAKISFAKQDENQALQYLETAKNYVTTDTANFTAALLHEIFLQQRDYKSAANVLEKVTDTSIFSKLTNNLLNAYYRSGNYKAISTIVPPLLEKYPDNPFLFDILSAVYEATERYDEAIKTIEQFLQRKDNEQFMMAKLAINFYKKGDYSKGVETLNKIDDYTGIPLEVKFLIADAYVKNKDYTKGLELAYQARMENLSDIQVHNRYMQIHTSITDLKQENYFPDTVSDNCYVVLTDDRGKTSEFILVSDPKHPNEVSLTESISKTLLGKKLNENFSMGNHNYLITSILWKYSYAFHNSMDQIGIRFNNEGAFKVMSFKEDESPMQQIESILPSFEERNEFDRDIERLYQQGKSTIGVNANISGLSPIKYWGKLAFTPDIGIYSVWSKLEMITGLDLLKKDIPIIFDITSLLALSHLDALDFIKSIPQNSYVTKSTVDLIQYEIDEIAPRMDTEHIIVNKIGGQYYRNIVTVDEKKKQFKNLSQFLKFIKSNIQEISPSISDDFQSKQERDRIMGKSFNETALSAKENGLILLSDDTFFRQLCFNESQVYGISTIIFLVSLRQQNLISENQLFDYFEKLIKISYRFVPVNEKSLFKICQDNNFSVSHPFINACDVFHASYLDNIQAVKLTVNFLLELYTSSLISNNRSFIAQFIFGKLFNGRSSSKVKSILVPFLDTRFRLLPYQKDELMQLIDTY